MYFQSFPRLFYDFKIPGSNQTKLYALTDITTNIRIRKAVLENITLYDEYDVQEGETPEIIAEKIYGNPELHWVIMIANQRYDYLKDFPMTSLELDEFVEQKYGLENKFKIHHYEKNGLITPAKAMLKVPTGVENTLKSHDILMNSTTYAKVETILPSYISNKEFLVTISSGKFETGDAVTVKGFRTNPTTSQLQLYNSIAVFTLSSNPFTLYSEYTSVSNFEYESSENEKKRRIKIISPSLIDQVIRELNSILQ